jgi:hypothetical protein
MARVFQGKQIFNTNTERDQHGKRIEDFVQSKLGVIPYPDSGYTIDPDGVEYRNNMTMDVDSGPGFIWSLRMPEGDQALEQEAATLGQSVQDVSLSGSTSWTTIPD